MNPKANLKPVARAVRVEIEPSSGTYFLVFEVVDEGFKAKVKQDWTQDLELRIIGQELIEDE